MAHVTAYWTTDAAGSAHLRLAPFAPIPPAPPPSLFRLAGELMEQTLRAQVLNGWRGEVYAMLGGVHFYAGDGRPSYRVSLSDAAIESKLREWIALATSAANAATTPTETT